MTDSLARVVQQDTLLESGYLEYYLDLSDTHIDLHSCTNYSMKKQILNAKHIIVYPLGGDTRNCMPLCVMIHIQEFYKKTYTFDYLQ